MTQRRITEELERKFDVIVEWRDDNLMYVEYVSNSMYEDEMQMPDWMADDIALWDYGVKVCDVREERYNYGIFIDFCEPISPN